MKPNFNEMNRSELRAYVLDHRDDLEAIRALFHHPDNQWVTMPPLFTSEGVPIEENIRLAEAALQRRIEQDRKQGEKT